MNHHTSDDITLIRHVMPCWRMFLLAVIVTNGCGTHSATKQVAESVSGKALDPLVPNPGPTSPIQFEDVTELSGITFSQVSGNSSEKHFPAANGSGVAIFDFDCDGLMDIYFLTARQMPFDPNSPGPQNKLFRNRDGLHFEEVSGSARLELSLFSHGAIHGDWNNDGFPDLALTTYGGTRLLLNNGDGTFQSLDSFTDDRWGTSAAALDFDEDGDLDLYVTHYGLWSIATNLHCGDTEKQLRTFCSPKRITPTVHALYENRGEGTFVDVIERAGIARTDGRGQGVVAADVNMDGHVDLYVANDLSPNFLFLNQADGTFRDVTDFCGAAFNRDGLTQAGMGVDCADVDRDGLPDLFVTNFRHEYNSLYRNLGQGTFMDKSHAAGVAGDSMDEVGWGTRLVDFDNDGWYDIFVANGHVDDNIAQLDPSASYGELPKVWRNVGGRFRFVGASAGSYFQHTYVGRGAAFGDLDNDGRIDIAVNHVDSPAVVLRNRSVTDPKYRSPWIRFVLIGRTSSRDAIGAHVTLTGEGIPQNIVQQRTSGASYLSAHDPRVLIGIGNVNRIAEASIFWPSGRSTVLRDLRPGQEVRLVEPVGATDETEPRSTPKDHKKSAPFTSD